MTAAPGKTSNGKTSETLDRALAFLRERVAPVAGELDRSTHCLREVVREAGEECLLALRRPDEYGGPAIAEEEFRIFQEEAARTSGSFAFLQTQHQSTVSILAGNANEALKRRYLPQMHDGTRLVGIGFSQLRREGEPLVRVEPVEGGYRATGRVPWITGFDVFQEYLLGATLPNGDSLFAIIPLAHVAGGTPTEPMHLAAMGSAATVAMELDGLFIPHEQVAFTKPGAWIRENDLVNIALQSQFAFGCARAGLDVVRREAKKPGKEFLAGYADDLDAELERCREETHAALADRTEATAETRLRLRAWAIELAVRCGHAAVTASSGAANATDHPAGRIYREALVYTVSAQTLPIMRATMDRLARRA